jgi:hypothetical protein
MAAMKGEPMANRSLRTAQASTAARPAATLVTDTIEQRTIALAEQLGRIVATIQAKTEGLMDRQTVHQQLTRIRDGASALMDYVGGGPLSSQTSRAPARRPKTKPARQARTQKSSPARQPRRLKTKPAPRRSSNRRR